MHALFSTTFLTSLLSFLLSILSDLRSLATSQKVGR